MKSVKIKSAILSGVAATSMMFAGAALAQDYSWTFQTSAQAGDNFFQSRKIGRTASKR